MNLRDNHTNMFRMIMPLQKAIQSIVFFFLFFQTSDIHSQISFRGAATSGSLGSASVVFTKTITSGSNIVLVIGVTAQDKAISNVRFNGTALTQFTLGTRNSMNVALYYLALGTLSANMAGTVQINYSSGTDSFVGAADYSGVFHSAPFINPTVSSNKSTNPSVTFSSSVGNVAFSLLGVIAASPTANGPSQTQYWTYSGSHSNRATAKPWQVRLPCRTPFRATKIG